MAIKCGNCHEHHDTVVQVKRCHGVPYRVLEMVLVDYLTATPVFCGTCGIRNTSHQNAAGTVGRYLKSDLHPEACATVQEELTDLYPEMPFADIFPANTWADWKEACRAYRAQEIPGLPGVTVEQATTLADNTQREETAHRAPARNDHYAKVRALRDEARGVLGRLVENHDKFRVAVVLPGEEKVRFFRLDVPVRGRWVGSVFTKEQAGDEYFKVRNPMREEAILTAVLKDPLSALTRYGLEIGACGVCGRTLTDEESRARGIGPVCADKMIGF